MRSFVYTSPRMCMFIRPHCVYTPAQSPAVVAARPAVFNETRARLTSDRLSTHERMHHGRVTSVLFK